VLEREEQIVRRQTFHLVATFLAIAALFISVNANADGAPLSDPATVRSVLATPDAEIDFAKAKLAFDKLISSTLDVDATLKQLDNISQVVSRMAGPSPSNRAKLTAIRTYLYESGDWNEHRPFQYDMTDPKGQKLSNKLLATYLDTRRGNCVTMPILFLILADRMHLPVALSKAPLHFFIKYTDDATGQTLNLETTSGGHPARDSWIRQQMPMTDQAIANGLYLRALTRRETLTAMAAVVVEADLERQRFGEGIDIADIILERDPTDVYMLAKRGSAFAGQIETEFVQKYSRPMDIPLALRPRYQMLQERNDSDFAKAEALGWREDQ
jgi:regulator of sirC expression with transglutaminase-like and TPR domain